MRKSVKLILLLLGVLLILPIHVFAEDYEAKIGNNNYATIEEAISAAKENEEIVLLKNISSGSRIEIPSGKNLIINLNGMQIDVDIINSGTLTIKNGTVSYIKNVEDGTLNLDGVTCEETSVLSGIRNYGIATIKNSTFDLNLSITNTGGMFMNYENATLTIESGTYTSSNIVNFYNYGNMIINGGTFVINDSNIGNRNYQTLTINGGIFKNAEGTFLENDGGNIIINDGVFTSKTVAENYMMYENSNITVNGGTFHTNGVAFSNSILSKNSKILLNGGQINMTGEDYVINESGENNTIQISNTNIDAFNSIGISLESDCVFIVGTDDDTVKKDVPLINIPNGTISGNDGDFQFYDGTINLKSKINENNIKITTPSYYYVHYDTNKDKTLDAYLSNQKQNVTTMTVAETSSTEVENPNTADINVLAYIVVGILVFIIFGISYKKIKSMQ